MNWKTLFGIDYPNGEFDVLTIGEAVVDLISLEETEDLFFARQFERFQGGSPTNIAMNISKLAGKAAIVSFIGNDGFGRFLRESLREGGVDDRFLFVDNEKPTSVNIISRTPNTADSIHLRFADYQLSPDMITEEVINSAKVIHASAFALSVEPARSAIEKAFSLAGQANKLISFDPNYNPIDWQGQTNVKEVIFRAFKNVHITKPSLDDARRLFGNGLSPAEYIQQYHQLGPRIVIFTMGEKGIILSDNGKQTLIPARQIKVVDATGAGDAFWAGFLISLLDNRSLLESVLFGREIVELGLSTVGPVQEHFNRKNIYQNVKEELKQF